MLILQKISQKEGIVMKTKVLALALALMLLLNACGSAPAETTAPAIAAPTYSQPAAVDGTSIRIGQYRAEIPDSFSVYSQDETSIVLSSSDLQCVVGLLASDMSSVGEDELKAYMLGLAAQKQDSTEVHTMVADMPLKSLMWLDMDEDMNASLIVQTDFTDSWYFYRIQVSYMNESAPEAAMSSTVDFLASFSADGVPARFDFVQ